VVANLLDPCMAREQFITTMIVNKCGIPEPGGMALARAIANGNTVRESILP
jgi:hypothetical protein